MITNLCCGSKLKLICAWCSLANCHAVFNTQYTIDKLLIWCQRGVPMAPWDLPLDLPLSHITGSCLPRSTLLVYWKWYSDFQIAKECHVFYFQSIWNVVKCCVGKLIFMARYVITANFNLSIWTNWRKFFLPDPLRTAIFRSTKYAMIYQCKVLGYFSLSHQFS